MAVKLIVFEVNSTRCPLLPRPLFLLLAEPQFEPQRVHSVQVVSEQPLVSDKTQVLIQLQGRFVGDLGLQYHLWTHSWARQGFVL